MSSNSSLRIAIITNRFAPYIGGIERQMAVVGCGLAHRGHKVTVLTRRYDRRLPARESLDGIMIERFGPRGQGVVSKWLVNLGTFRRLITSKPRFDCLLVTQVSATAISPALARALGGAPLVLRPIEVGEFTGEVSRLSLSRLPPIGRQLVQTMLQVVRRMAYRQARVVVAPSEALAQEAQGFGFRPDSIFRVPNPVDITVFRPASAAERRDLRTALGIPLDAEVVTFTGRFVQGKGILTLAHAWKKLIPMHPKAMLILVGSGPGPDSPLDEEQALRRFIRDESLEARVIMPGFRLDVERYLRASDLFIFPSAAEGFGNSLTEAMACGLPVICGTGVAGAAEDLVRDGEHGLKFELENATSLCARIHDLLSDEGARLRMGAAARRVVEQRLAVEVAVDAYEQALRKAIELG